MVRDIRIKRVVAAYDGVNLVFGAGIEPHLEMSNRIAEKLGYKLETEEDRRNTVLNVYKNGYLPKYIYSELSACMNGKEKDVCNKKDIELLYTVAKKVYDTANIKIENFNEDYKDFRFSYDSLERSWMLRDEAFIVQRKRKEDGEGFYKITCYVSSVHVVDSDKKLFNYVYGILDDHYDMIAGGFPDGNDKIRMGYPDEFEEAFKILSPVNLSCQKIELCVIYLVKHQL